MPTTTPSSTRIISSVRTIELLKANDADFETTLIYLSDHGESSAKTASSSTVCRESWLPTTSSTFRQYSGSVPATPDVDVEALAAKRNLHFTHDNLFHTVLGLLEVETSVYRKELDILDGARRPE